MSEKDIFIFLEHILENIKDIESFSENISREDLIKNKEKLNARSADYVESKARLEMRTRRNELVNRLKKVELYETTKPAKVIRINRLKTD
jgi:hypothetical protein